MTRFEMYCKLFEPALGWTNVAEAKKDFEEWEASRLEETIAKVITPTKPQMVEGEVPLFKNIFVSVAPDAQGTNVETLYGLDHDGRVWERTFVGNPYYKNLWKKVSTKALLEK